MVQLTFVEPSQTTKHFQTLRTFGRYGRAGILHTRAGDVLTPTFMPDATRGAVKSLSPEQVYATGVQVVLMNTYHLHLMPGEAAVRALGGVHGFGNYSGPILTDSGGFQVFSLSKLTKITEEGVVFKHPITGELRTITPEKSIQIQFELGADMIVAFDHLVGLGDTASSLVHEAFHRTHRWLDRCIAEYKRQSVAMEPAMRPILFGVVQGGLDLEMREESLRIVQESEVGGIAIGGLSVGETRAEMTTILEHLAPLYDADRPRFLLGVGTPQDLEIAVDNGIDMLDCVLPTRNARHGVVWGEQHAKLHLTNEKYKTDTEPMLPGCDCYACLSGFTKGFIRHQYKVAEPLAGSLASIHNLRYLSRMCEYYRNDVPSPVVKNI